MQVKYSSNEENKDGSSSDQISTNLHELIASHELSTSSDEMIEQPNIEIRCNLGSNDIPDSDSDDGNIRKFVLKTIKIEGEGHKN